jgi:hypothetical protein
MENRLMNHSMRRIAIVAVVALCCVGATQIARAYPVQHAASLDDLAKEADLICKAVVVTVKPVKDDWFNPVPGFQAYSAELKVISVLNGTAPAETIAFHYYGEGERGPMMFMPQNYRLTAGRTYIFFAKETAAQGIYRQLWKNHRTKADQGVLLAADQKPCERKSVKDVFWTELTGLLQSEDESDVVYTIQQLDQMSGGSYDDLKDFSRVEVLKVIEPLIRSQHEEVAKAAILALGSRNPYLSDEYAVFWLATVGRGDIPGYAKWSLTKEYLGGKLFWKELAAVADKDTRLAVRVLAIRAMGRSQQPEVLNLASRWVESPEAEIRQAATLLLADFPDKPREDTLRSLAKDPSPLVRRSAARAIGYGQFARLVPVLAELLRDPEVASTAALSLLSFSLDQNRDVLKANLNHPQYKSVFVNALARETPQPYLGELAEIIRTKRQPEQWWGGSIPWGVSWNILFKYAQGRPPAAWKDGQLDSILDALEYPASGDPKGPSYYSSSEPRDLYAMYVQRGLLDRAKKFRAACKRAVSYDIDYFFDMVDKNPGTYQRQ